jgi:hypothetical protein
MLNIRTISLSVISTLILLLTVQLAIAKTEVASPTANKAESVPERQESSAVEMNTPNLTAYRFQFGECFDVSIKDQASCRNENLSTLQPRGYCDEREPAS